MLQQSSRNECGINGDQPTMTNPIGDSMTTAVAGTNCDGGATDSESDDVDDSGSDFWEDEEDEDDSYYNSVLWGNCHLGLWDDGDDDDLDSSEDEDNDHGSSTLPASPHPLTTEPGMIIAQQDVSGAPLMKRAKTSHAVPASQSSSKSVRREAGLSLLPTMPLDVLFEIFSHLSPMDIISLSHISKAFHRTLSSRNAPAVWKSIRQRFSAPDGPDWMSEEAWADLLFGHKCQSCGQSGGFIKPTVDFHLLKRICVSCKREHYVSSSEVEKRFPTFDFVILLVPSTSIWSSRVGSTNFHLDVHLDSMVNKLTALKQDSDAQVLHCFMEERKRRLQCIRQNVSSWRICYEQILKDGAQEEKDIEKRRLEQVKEKFKELGYVKEDLGFLRSRQTCRGPGNTQLTTKIWSRIRPILEPEVKEVKAQRLKRKLAKIRCKRRQVLAARYKEFQRTLHPSQWKYLPRTLDIAAYEGFSQHIEAEVGVEVNGSTFDDAFLEFPSLHAAATEQRKTTLRALIGDTAREDGEIRNDSIDLATTVFKCDEGHKFLNLFKYLFGWDDIASHHCRPEMEGIDCPHYYSLRIAPSELKYIPEIAVVIRRLAQLIGLDAATATATDFDKKDKRFGCEGCPYTKEHGQYFQTGYTWRNLAVHLETHKTHNPNLFITVLSDTAEDELKQCERKDKKWDANQWSCSHCPEYLGNLQARQSIVEHLSESHGIQVPSEPTDLFFFERCRTDSTKLKFSVPATEVGKFRCLVCQSNTTRRFMLKGVESHLKAKHNIISGQYGVDYAFA